MRLYSTGTIRLQIVPGDSRIQKQSGYKQQQFKHKGSPFHATSTGKSLRKRHELTVMKTFEYEICTLTQNGLFIGHIVPIEYLQSMSTKHIVLLERFIIVRSDGPESHINDTCDVTIPG